MKTYTYPQASLLQIRCPACGCEKPENGGYRIRKHRDVEGTREVKVMKVRCSRCLKHLKCLYPPGVSRYKWYSQKLEGIFALLDIHQVDESCADEIAQHLGYSIKPETRASWQATRAWRVDRLESDKLSTKVAVASLDEFKVGHWWVYTLTDKDSQAVLGHAISESRSEEVVRDLIAQHDAQAFISDGCPRIEAACEWFADKPHGRCWFHVIKEVLANVAQEERDLVAHELRFLYTRATLEDAQWFLGVLQQRYPKEVLQPLLSAWSQLKLYWLVDAMPLTNNASETLYNATWSRSKKRVVKALHRAQDWLKEALWRWNRHPIRGKSPRQRLTKQHAKPWLPPLLTPLGRSYDFQG